MGRESDRFNLRAADDFDDNRAEVVTCFAMPTEEPEAEPARGQAASGSDAYWM